MSHTLTFILTVALAPTTAPSGAVLPPIAETAPSVTTQATTSTTATSEDLDDTTDTAARPSVPDAPEAAEEGAIAEDAATEESEATAVDMAPAAAYSTGPTEDELAPMLAEPDPEPPADEPEDLRPGRRGIGLMASGASLLAIGAPLLPIGLGMRSVARTQIALLDDSNSDQAQALVDQAQRRATGGMAMAIVGGALVAVGVPLLATGIVRFKQSKSRRTAQLQRVTPNVAFGREGASVGVHMRF